MTEGIIQDIFNRHRLSLEQQLHKHNDNKIMRLMLTTEIRRATLIEQELIEKIKQNSHPAPRDYKNPNPLIRFLTVRELIGDSKQ